MNSDEKLQNECWSQIRNSIKIRMERKSEIAVQINFSIHCQIGGKVWNPINIIVNRQLRRPLERELCRSINMHM